MPIQWSKSVGHEGIKEVLSRAFENGGLGHAYLFTGAVGVGKFAVALEFAQALLCESATKPCGYCTSCQQVASHSHPDFRVLFPIAFDSKKHKISGKTTKLTEAGWEYLGEKVRYKIAHPYAITPNYHLSPMVDWIRELTSAINRGSSRGDTPTVVIIEGIENFRKESANALLKTLEEPPPNTIIILLSRSLTKVLPTIRSRCQLFRFGEIPQEEILPFLHEIEPDASQEELNIALHESFGSPGVALARLKDEGNALNAHVEHYLEIVAMADDRLGQALALEQFVDGDEQGIQRDFDQAIALFDALLFVVRTHFLKQYHNEAEYIFTHSEGAVFESLGVETYEKLLMLLEDALTSARLRTPLLTVFVTTTLLLVEILHE